MVVIGGCHWFWSHLSGREIPKYWTHVRGTLKLNKITFTNLHNHDHC